MFFDVKLGKNLGNIRSRVQPCSKPSAKRENVGVWGHSPQEKFAVSNVRGVLCCWRAVASCIVTVRRVRPPAVRPWLRACVRSPAPARPENDSVGISGPFWTPLRSPGRAGRPAPRAKPGRFGPTRRIMWFCNGVQLPGFLERSTLIYRRIFAKFGTNTQ